MAYSVASTLSITYMGAGMEKISGVDLLTGSLSFVGLGVVASLLPAVLQPLARLSPTTCVLEGMRAAVLRCASVAELWVDIFPLLVAGVDAIPLGLRVFGVGEHCAKRTGKLKRNG